MEIDNKLIFDARQSVHGDKLSIEGVRQTAMNEELSAELVNAARAYVEAYRKWWLSMSMPPYNKRKDERHKGSTMQDVVPGSNI